MRKGVHFQAGEKCQNILFSTRVGFEPWSFPWLHNKARESSHPPFLFFYFFYLPGTTCGAFNQENVHPYNNRRQHTVISLSWKHTFWAYLPIPFLSDYQGRFRPTATLQSEGPVVQVYIAKSAAYLITPVAMVVQQTGAGAVSISFDHRADCFFVCFWVFFLVVGC